MAEHTQKVSITITISCVFSYLKPWTENTLHSTVLVPPLERDRYTWGDRGVDFDVWSYPNTVFNPQDPISIQLAGEKLRQEKVKAKKAENELVSSYQ